jgi:hypothetical protein
MEVVGGFAVETEEDEDDGDVTEARGALPISLSESRATFMQLMEEARASLPSVPADPDDETPPVQCA